MTHAGVILGTAAYMAPEQARGRQVDRRADVWAFGALVFEMLTARKAFAGETISDTLASVMRDEPDWSALPPGLSPRWRRLLERCLAKDPRQRLQAIGEARIALEDLAANPVEADARRPSVAQRAADPRAALARRRAGRSWRSPSRCGESSRRRRHVATELSVVPFEGQKIGMDLSLPPDGDLARRPCAGLHGPRGRSAPAEAAAARHARGRRDLRRRGRTQPLLLPRRRVDRVLRQPQDVQGLGARRHAGGAGRRPAGPPRHVARRRHDRLLARGHRAALPHPGERAGLPRRSRRSTPTSASARTVSRARSTAGPGSCSRCRRSRAPAATTTRASTRSRSRPVSAVICTRAPGARSGRPAGFCSWRAEATCTPCPSTRAIRASRRIPCRCSPGSAATRRAGRRTSASRTTGRWRGSPGASPRRRARSGGSIVRAASRRRRFRPVPISQLKLSPDGARALVLAGPGGGASDLWLADLRTGGMNRLTHGNRGGPAVWIPDGARIAYSRPDPTGGEAVVVRRLDGAGGEREIYRAGNPLIDDRRHPRRSRGVLQRLRTCATAGSTALRWTAASPRASCRPRARATSRRAWCRPTVAGWPTSRPRPAARRSACGASTGAAEAGRSRRAAAGGVRWGRDGRELFFVTGEVLVRVPIEASGRRAVHRAAGRAVRGPAVSDRDLVSRLRLRPRKRPVPVHAPAPRRGRAARDRAVAGLGQEARGEAANHAVATMTEPADSRQRSSRSTRSSTRSCARSSPTSRRSTTPSNPTCTASTRMTSRGSHQAIFRAAGRP